MNPIKAMSCGIACLVLGSAASAADRQQLNVLLIISDDLRDTVGCYGNAAVKTPHIDRLADRGVRFDRAYAQYPVCNPSRTSFLTGLRPEQTGVVANTTLFRTKLPDVVTLPQLLKQNGWHAAAYGKIFHLHGRDEVEKGRWMDLGKSWADAAAFQPTPAGHKGEIRDLTGGQLAWCRTGRMEGIDDDQPDGQNAAHVIRAIERQMAAGKPWIIGAGQQQAFHLTGVDQPGEANQFRRRQGGQRVMQHVFRLTV